MDPSTIRSKKRIVIVAMPDVVLLDIAGPADVFNRADRTLQLKNSTEGYEVTIISPESSKTVNSSSGIGLICSETIESLSGDIDTLLIAGYSSSNPQKLTEKFLNWLIQIAKTTRRIGSVCRGAFVLAEAGLLDGRKATTHWKYCRELQKTYPKTSIDPDPIFVKDGNIYTSAGVSSGMDLALALVEEDFGREIAVDVARQLVLYLRRPGNQSQFSELLSYHEPSSEPIKNLKIWAKDHLSEQLTIEQLAEKSAMSPRNFARVFQKETGITPGKYIEKIRVERARKLLEETYMSLDQISEECGIGSADTMRRLFLRHLKVGPSEYRKSFRTAMHSDVTEDKEWNSLMHT